jgi:hypothetical protein
MADYFSETNMKVFISGVEGPRNSLFLYGVKVTIRNILEVKQPRASGGSGGLLMEPLEENPTISSGTSTPRCHLMQPRRRAQPHKEICPHLAVNRASINVKGTKICNSEQQNVSNQLHQKSRNSSKPTGIREWISDNVTTMEDHTAFSGSGNTNGRKDSL